MSDRPAGATPECPRATPTERMERWRALSWEQLHEMMTPESAPGPCEAEDLASSRVPVRVMRRISPEG